MSMVSAILRSIWSVARPAIIALFFGAQWLFNAIGLVFAVCMMMYGFGLIARDVVWPMMRFAGRLSYRTSAWFLRGLFGSRRVPIKAEEPEPRTEYSRDPHFAHPVT